MKTFIYIALLLSCATFLNCKARDVKNVQTSKDLEIKAETNVSKADTAVKKETSEGNFTKVTETEENSEYEEEKYTPIDPNKPMDVDGKKYLNTEVTKTKKKESKKGKDSISDKKKEEVLTHTGKRLDSLAVTDVKITEDEKNKETESGGISFWWWVLIAVILFFVVFGKKIFIFLKRKFFI